MPLFSKVKDIFQRGSSAKKRKIYHNVRLDNPEEYWEIIGELGDGAYGKVYKAEHKIQKNLAALKLVPLEEEDDLENFMIEIDILCEFHHKNIVELLEAYHYDGKLWMYLEYCDGGAVDTIMVDLDRPLNEKQIAFLCRELLEALKYIHSQKVIHRDLKAGNVLLTMDGGVKLADFGVSAKNKHTLDKRGTFIGTPYWLAPEVILCETFLDANYDYKADIWSLGISLIEFAEMDPPNHEVSPVRVMLKIQKSDPPRLIHPSRYSKNFNNFLAKCLVKDPNHRPTAEELLSHPFINHQLETKSIVDLLLEYKAEVVEEDVDDESEDQDASRLSVITDITSTSSQFDKESICSVAEGAIQLPDINETSTTSGEPASVVSERKVSKGQAPMPPPAASIQSPKKGPAPSIPAVPSPTSATPTPDVISSETSPSSTTPTGDIKNKTPPLPDDGKTSPRAVLPKATSSTPLSSDGIGLASPTLPNDKTASPIPGDSKSSPQTILPKAKVNSVVESPPMVIDNIATSTSMEKVGKLEHDRVKGIQDIDIPSSVIDPLSSAENYDDKVTVNNRELADSDQAALSPICDGNSTNAIVSETSLLSGNAQERSVVDITEPLELKLKSDSSPKSNISPVTEPSDVVLASISSEGTVIVQTPTSSPTDQEVPTKRDNIVTYTVPNPDGSDKEISTVEIVSSGKISPDSPSSNLSSISEAEAQAVLILDSAIDSAIDSIFDSSPNKDSTTDDTFPLSPIHSTETKGDIMVLAAEQLEDDQDSGHKLDRSEVVICNSSILQDGTSDLDNSKSQFEVTLEKNEKIVRGITETDNANISVVQIQEDQMNNTQNEHVDYTSQVSVTIEGTTVEASNDFENASPLHDALSAPEDSGRIVKSSLLTRPGKSEATQTCVVSKSTAEGQDNIPLKPIANGIRHQSSKFSDKSDTLNLNSDKENHDRHESSVTGGEVELRRQSVKKVDDETLAKNQDIAKNKKNKEEQDLLALRRKTRKRTRRFEIDGVIVTTTTSKVIYGDDEEGTNTSAHLARKQELREIKILQKQEQKQFQELSTKAELVRLEQERKFELEKNNLLRNYDSQIEILNRQQKQQVERAEARQEVELKGASKRIRTEQEKDLKSFRESLKQELKLMKYEVDLLPKDKRKDTFKVRKEQLDQDQAEREKTFLEKLNENHEISVKRLNDAHREHIALKERQFLEEKHQLMRCRENALWETEERHLQDKHQLAKEQLKDVYYIQRHQMLTRHSIELEQVRRMNQQKEDSLLKRQTAEKRQLPKRIRQEMKTREKMFREKIRISMTTLNPTHDDEKDQIRLFQEQEKIKYDAERQRAERKHRKQLEELRAATEYAIKELEILQNEKGKLLMEHESTKLKSLDEEYQRELRSWKGNLMPRKQKLEDGFDRQLSEQERFYGDYLNRGLSSTPSLSVSSLTSSLAGSNIS